MASYEPLTVSQGDIVTVKLTLADEDGPLDLDANPPRIYVKDTVAVADSDATVLTVGSGITVTDAAEGLATAVIPSTETVAPGERFWHCVAGGVTAMYGPLNILDV